MNRYVLASVLAFMLGCGYRERMERIEHEQRVCIAAITSAPTVDEARAIARACNLRIERNRR